MTSAPADVSVKVLPWATFAYLQPKNRQDPKWTYRQALVNTILKVCLHKYCTFHKGSSQVSLKPGLERSRFVLIDPARSDLYNGVAYSQVTSPEIVGATWYPRRPSRDFVIPHDQHIMLHFHGGSYIVGDGRISSCGFLAKHMLAHTPSQYVLSVQYRLTGPPNGRFPAQLQDAISAYFYLLDSLHIPASQIILCGDSAGANLALGLLRYITNFDNSTLLPAPKCALLLSPWTNIPEAVDTEAWDRSANYKTEYVPASFPARGATLLLHDLEITKSVEEQIAPIKHPFSLPAPILVVTGGKEVLCEENRAFAQTYKSFGHNEAMVDLYVSEPTPHDLFMIGWIMGFQKEARECAEVAGTFIRQFNVQRNER
ncbi:hypothetical protein N7539_009258 [Penicillium diatomitis]|uniref:Alpha/beta hydrolase fold-3 domain-containing protein n=1 Tax=Penicillium diatomitis TaxID=2819901 RepID=A0A9X0BJJ2_9EURO|nr:uncharacterized protein N7539_009258 [Penicillium diatomitis]KAJ5469640.1 hypothetical protein N7539_009258 [Penicillium diatomitis]